MPRISQLLRLTSFPLSPPLSPLISGNLTPTHSIMSDKIFQAIVHASETHTLDPLVFENVDPEDFAHTMKHLEGRPYSNKAYSVR